MQAMAKALVGLTRVKSVNLFQSFPSVLMSQPSRFGRGRYHQTIHLVNWQTPVALDDSLHPKERRRLHPVLKVPIVPPATKNYLYPRRIIDRRGPEPVHRHLLYKQYGIQALEGGEMAFVHFEMLRLAINRLIDEKIHFATWRVDAPWKPKTKRAPGMALGGGRGNIHHYVTPVKSDRIIIELGGDIQWKEAYLILSRVIRKMPFRCRFVSQELLEADGKIDQMIHEKNINPFTFEKCLKKNMLNSQSFVSPWSYHWGPKYL